MDLTLIAKERPLPTALTTIAVLLFLVTVAYFAGIIPGIPKTLQTFVSLVQWTVVLTIAAGIGWTISFLNT